MRIMLSVLIFILLVFITLCTYQKMHTLYRQKNLLPLSKNHINTTKRIYHAPTVTSHTAVPSKKDIQHIDNRAIDYIVSVLKHTQNDFTEHNITQLKLHILLKKLLVQRKKSMIAIDKMTQPPKETNSPHQQGE